MRRTIKAGAVSRSAGCGPADRTAESVAASGGAAPKAPRNRAARIPMGILIALTLGDFGDGETAPRDGRDETDRFAGGEFEIGGGIDEGLKAVGGT
ncbi:hypothetical protein ACFO4E_18160 [Nocardiopsis mangrovi]|uniref:Uncharacterized protein n=1 Tax=Nocardiopsis mangrovi TaxID=1179818 RepID=A0ABV9E2H8_9ACTN